MSFANSSPNMSSSAMSMSSLSLPSSYNTPSELDTIEKKVNQTYFISHPASGYSQLGLQLVLLHNAHECAKQFLFLHRERYLICFAFFTWRRLIVRFHHDYSSLIVYNRAVVVSLSMQKEKCQSLPIVKDLCQKLFNRQNEPYFVHLSELEKHLNMFSLQGLAVVKRCLLYN